MFFLVFVIVFKVKFKEFCRDYVCFRERLLDVGSKLYLSIMIFF